MSKTKADPFEGDRNILKTPYLSDENGLAVASVEVYLNKHGDIAVSAVNYDNDKGIYALSLDFVCSTLDDDTLEYLFRALRKEVRSRRSLENEYTLN